MDKKNKAKFNIDFKPELEEDANNIDNKKEDKDD